MKVILTAVNCRMKSEIFSVNSQVKPYLILSHFSMFNGPLTETSPPGRIQKFEFKHLDQVELSDGIVHIYGLERII